MQWKWKWHLISWTPIQQLNFWFSFPTLNLLMKFGKLWTFLMQILKCEDESLPLSIIEGEQKSTTTTL